jgi:hypothetical protein
MVPTILSSRLFTGSMSAASTTTRGRSPSSRPSSPSGPSAPSPCRGTHSLRYRKSLHIEEQTSIVRYSQVESRLQSQVTYLRNYRLVSGQRYLESVFPIRIRLDPHSIWAWIRDPDPYSKSGSGFGIQMYKNRLKSQNLLRLTLRKMLRFS